jgi:nucleotide-binding universal stress UspA family protein
LSYWFAGSVSRQALRQANAMILFLREGQRGFVDPDNGQIKLARVLIPIDGRIAYKVAIRRALALIDGLGVPVEKRLLHVGEAAPPGCPKDIPLTLTLGPVAEAVLTAAKRFGADLIVMPTAGKRGMLAAFRDSVSAKILDDARWPVLSVPALESGDA